ncbi:tripartite tricarboxylate transporter TctB family protein [Ahrensia marina]|uniref:tripartite tricarboxylate transporter TctB family protein n=1 Tax=Ahrensia marina TaxID=1514904 RepID=UPI0035CF7231
MVSRADTWAGLFLAILGIGLFWLTRDVRITEAGLIGPRFVPQVVSVLLAVGGLTLVFGNTESNDSGVSPAPLRAVSLILIGVAHVYLTPRIGYLATSALIAASTLALFGVRDWRILLAGTLALPLIMHLAFIELMGVFMPRGRWFDVLSLIA